MTSKDVLSDCLPSDTRTGISSLVNLNNYEDQKSPFKTFSGLKCYNVNVHSLLPKLDEIRYNIIVSDLKIQCLSVNESFLSSDIGDHEISIDNFCVFRKDRNRHGGGVTLYVSKDLSPVAVEIQSEIKPYGLQSNIVNINLLLVHYIDLETLALTTMSLFYLFWIIFILMHLI